MKTMMKNKQLEMVKDWHEAFNVPVQDKPVWPGYTRARLRQNIVREEARELCEAIEQGTIHDVAKELIDLLYVTYGTALEFGLTHVLDECFEEVQRSNMSKLGEDGKPILRADGKVLKGPNYIEANLEKVFKIKPSWWRTKY